MRLKLPKIYPITDASISGISHTEQVKRLIAGGAKIVQLREKSLPPLDWFEDAQNAARLCRENGVMLIVNDRVDVALAIGAEGVHLGQTDLPPAAARLLLGDKAVIGFSTHTLEQAREAVAFPVDYIAFGPVFSTATKKDADAVVGLEMLRQVREIAGEMPLVAIGGISLSNARSVLVAGADSLAMIGALVADPSIIEERIKEFSRL